MHCKIDHLSKYPGLIPVLARWHHRQWQHVNPDSYDEETRIRDYQQMASESASLPQMLIAHVNGHALGSVRLVESDMDTHPEFSPWLATLYVPPDFRRQGIATKLICEIEITARQLGFNQLHLFTQNMQAMYKNLGWQELFREKYYDEEVVIMTKMLIDNE